jgi:hypothetical protein
VMTVLWSTVRLLEAMEIPSAFHFAFRETQQTSGAEHTYLTPNRNKKA